MEKILIESAQPYQVCIGQNILPQAGALAAEVLQPATLALVMDETVAAYYGREAKAAFQQAGFQVAEYFFPAGEQAKSMDRLAHLLEFLAEKGLGRNDCIAALGGGVTGDLAGLAAALYQRGIAYIQLPTTLLAAVDSSVGGKTAVNLQSGKNLAGAFWQPRLVLCDCQTFATLPQAEISAGAAECVKYAVLSDPALLQQLTDCALDAPWQQIVQLCVRYKADIVRMDEKEQGLRQLLNLGHTIGHAAERLSDYSIRHGEAVAMGLMIISRAAEKMSLARDGISAEIAAALRALRLPLHCPYAAEQLAEIALTDKKRRGEHINLVLPEDIGKCRIYPLPIEQLLPLIASGMED
jgi:3-dehydroquinate synthase